jgi:UDP-glucose 6-dehydrogenase
MRAWYFSPSGTPEGVNGEADLSQVADAVRATRSPAHIGYRVIVTKSTVAGRNRRTRSRMAR